MNDLAGRLRRGENAQRRTENGTLRVGITHIAERAAERMGNGGDARGADGRLIRRHHTEDHSGDPRCFEHPRDQSHGPAAIGSNGGKDRARYALRLHARRDRRR